MSEKQEVLVECCEYKCSEVVLVSVLAPLDRCTPTARCPKCYARKRLEDALSRHRINTSEYGTAQPPGPAATFEELKPLWDAYEKEWGHE